MTMKQLQKKAEIAIKHGYAILSSGSFLFAYDDYFSLQSPDGNVIDTQVFWEDFDYLVD